MEMTNAVMVVAGICLLMFGRRLFWLFVGVMGFLYGLALAPGFIHGQPGWVLLAVAVSAGFLGSILAVFLQRIVIALAGFSAGSYLAYAFIGMYGLGTGGITWLASIAAGVLCAVLFTVFFDWAVIILSSLMGALLVTRSIHGGTQVLAAVFMILSIAGIAVQAHLVPKAKG